MKTLVQYFLTIIMIYLALPMNGQDSFTPVTDVESLKNKLSEYNSRISTIESDFEQEQYLSVMTEKIFTKGYFCFKKENNLRWEYLEPYTYLIVISNEKIYIKDEEKVSKYDIESNIMFKEINKMMVGMVNGDILNNKEFQLSYFENNINYRVNLVPANKEMKEYISTIEIYLNKKDMSVDEIRISDPGGDYTNIFFKNKRLNQPVSDEKFTAK
ncbi:MAG: outer membrane lipoprotein carrier protein LolA [Bacteroidia bacterium]|nr:outer membrane lipoprotein carrier protein LolA [Bacteroidia bacterium]